MLLFAVAHAVQLEDGGYAVRAPEFVECEARHARVDLAREQFGDALRARLLAMIEAGEVPPLYTYEELGPSFAGRCTVQIPAPDRLRGTFDRVMAVRVKLPSEAAARLERMRAAPRHVDVSASSPGQDARVALDTSAADAENRERLDPSARLALVAARLAQRDRPVG
jgi:hypothetical protein